MRVVPMFEGAILVPPFAGAMLVDGWMVKEAGLTSGSNSGVGFIVVISGSNCGDGFMVVRNGTYLGESSVVVEGDWTSLVDGLSLKISLIVKLL